MVDMEEKITELNVSEEAVAETTAEVTEDVVVEMTEEEAAEVSENLEKLEQKGYKEIIVTGIEIASWGVDLPGKPKLAELLEAVIIASANDACVALAEHTAGSEAQFVKQMNLRA